MTPSRCLRQALLATLLTSLPAAAQFRDAWGSTWNNPVSASIGSSLYWRTMVQAPKSGGSGTAKGQPTTPATASPSPKAQADFPPTRTRLAARPLAESMGEDAAHRRDLEGVFIQFLDQFEKDAAADKEPRSMARAAAFFIVTNYIVATGKEPAETQVNALQGALARNLSTHARYQGMAARQRQELYEMLVILGYLPIYGLRDGEEKHQPDRVDLFRNMARQGLKTLLGATPEQMTFTEQGLAIR